jgi:P-type Ca2+ transporter type 2C
MEQLWHSLGLPEVFGRLDSNEEGISTNSILSRLKRYGKNTLPEEKPLSTIRLFFSQFHNPLIYILLVAFSISLSLGHLSDALFIIVVLLINTTVGFYQEYKADRSILALKKIVSVSTRVIRDGNLKEVDGTELVPGDVFILRAGDKVPADARIIESKNLKINESSLTGEWVAVHKKDGLVEKEASLGDRTNTVFMGTLVEEGRGKAIVVEIGPHTAIGNIVSLVKEIEERKTPLQKKISKLSRLTGAFIIFIICLVALIGYLQDQSFADIFITSLALAVSAIPAGLLPTVTVILVLGMKRILKQKGLVRKLVANETLGSVTVICTDKTGTLTEGKMQVSHIFASKDELFNKGNGLPPKEIKNGIESHILALKTSLFTSEAFIENPNDELAEWIVRGHSTEQALVLASAHSGLEQRTLNAEYKIIEQQSFDSSKKYAISIRELNGKRVLYATGAPEIILDKSHYVHCEKDSPLKDSERITLMNKLDDLAKKGLRIVACAYREIDKNMSIENLDKLLEKLTFIGFIALKDPLREETKQSIAETKRAGIRTVLITGDHRHTALAIATEIGIEAREDTILEGKQIEEMDEKLLQEKTKTVNIYARVSPSHKLKIVRALQTNNEVVAMVGDGVNDAPALKAADVGVAVGSGTDVAKEVADVVLLDNNFKTIVKAIEQGRVVFENIRKVFVYLIADDFSELFLFLAAMIFGLPLPLVAAQILWINLIEDGFPSLSLATEQETKGVMDEKPRDPNESILSKPMRKWMVSIFFVTGSAAFLSFVGFWNMTGDLEKARVMIFTLMCLDSLIFAFAVRSFKRPLWRGDIFSNYFLNGAVLIGLVLLIGAVYFVPFQKLLSTGPLGATEWIIILLISTIEIIILELFKKRFFRPKLVHIS